MEARVARPIPPALPVFGAAGKKAEAPGTAAPYAAERLYDEGHDLVAFDMPRIVVVALVEGHVPFARGMVEGAVSGHALALATEDNPIPPLLGVAEGNKVADMGALPGARGEAQAGGDFGVGEPVRAPRRGTGLDDVGHMADIVPLVRVSLTLVA